MACSCIAASPQPCPLLGSWQACLFSSYGLPKATLGILARLQTLPSAFGLLLHRSLACVRRETAFKPSPAPSNPPQRLWPTPAPQPCPLLGSWQACLFSSCGLPKATLGSWQACLFSSYGLPKATLGILARLQTLPSAFKPSPAPLAYSCTAALPSSRQLAGVPLLFLWASESDVRHFGPASNAPQRLWPTPASQPHRSLALFSAAGRPASESDVRHFGPPSNPPQPLQTLPQRLWPTPAPQPCPLLGSWQACLFSSYGLPKATLGILARLQTLPSAFGLLLRRSLACVRREPGEGASGTCSPCTAALELSLWNLPPPPAPQPCPLLGSWHACLFSSYGLPKATLGILARLQTLPSAFGLLLHRSFVCVRRETAFKPSPAPSNPPQRLWPTPAPQPCPFLGSWQPCLFSSYGLPKATLGILARLQTLPSAFNPSPAPLAYSCAAALPSSRQLAGVPLLFLWASESDVRHFGPASNAPQRLWPTPASQPHRSLALFSAAGRPASESDVMHFGPPSNPPQRLQTLPSAFGLLRHRSLALFSAAGRRASSLLMGFRKRR